MHNSQWGNDVTSDSLGSVKSQQECKPDYEKMIGEAKRKLAITQMFLTACESFILDGPPVVNRKELKSLLGFLYIYIQERTRALQGLMEQAEKEG